MTDLEQIEFFKRQIADAKEALATFIELRWPVGSPVTWERLGRLQYGEVIALSEDRLQVRNDLTGRKYWIDVFWVTQALKRIERIEGRSAA